MRVNFHVVGLYLFSCTTILHLNFSKIAIIKKSNPNAILVPTLIRSYYKIKLVTEQSYL